MSLSAEELKKQSKRDYYLRNKETVIRKAKENDKRLRSTKEGTIYKLLIGKKTVSKRDGIPFDLDYPFLLSIATDKCPVFGTPFVWVSYGRGYGKIDSPSLDRIIPELGYVKGNVVFISNVANTIKNNATEKELYAVADWLHEKRKEVLDAFKDRPAPLPAAPDTPGRKHSTHGTVHGVRVGQERDGSHHHQGELFGEDVGDRPQASS